MIYIEPIEDVEFTADCTTVDTPTNSATKKPDSPNFPSKARELGLADPADRPQADIVIFDGQCSFCQKQVLRLNRFDGGQRLAFISLHDPRVRQWYPNLTHDQLMEQMWVVSADGQQYGGAAAIRHLSRRLPRLWWAMPFLHIPFSMPLWQWFYRQVAIRRYRIDDRNQEACEDACQVHFGSKGEHANRGS